jgi:hypothetical protein
MSGYDPGRRGVIGCFLLLATFIALFSVWSAGGAYTEAFPRPFDSASWKATDIAKSSRRCGMVADLKFRVGIVGSTVSELNLLLGDPDDPTVYENSSYWVLCPSFMDVWVLEVQWRNGRAISAVVRDT